MLVFLFLHVKIRGLIVNYNAVKILSKHIYLPITKIGSGR